MVIVYTMFAPSSMCCLEIAFVFVVRETYVDIRGVCTPMGV